MKVLVSIVNYRTGALVVDCLESLAPEVEREEELEVVVIDNQSGDNSVELIEQSIEREGWGRWASVRRADRNGGFSYGNNVAIAPALASDSPPDYVLLLNPDTRVREGAIHELVRFLESHPEVGIAGSRLEDPDGTQQHSLFRFFSLRGELEAGARLGILSRLFRAHIVAHPLSEEASAFPIDWVAGASMMIRRAVFEDIGLMDAEYFLYFEETDFCLAARRAGWSCWYVPESRVVHFVGQSTGVTSSCAATRRLPRYWFESRRRFFRKNHGLLYAILADAAAVIGCSLYQIKRSLLGRPNEDPLRFVRDLLLFNLSPTPRDTPRFTTPSEAAEPIDGPAPAQGGAKRAA